MRYVIRFPEDGYDSREVLVPTEAESKETIIEEITAKNAIAVEQKTKYNEYRNAFRFSLQETCIKERPKFGRHTVKPTSDRMKAAQDADLAEHQQRLAEFDNQQELLEREIKEYMAKCPYSDAYSQEVPKLENIYEYPEEFWTFLKEQR